MRSFTTTLAAAATLASLVVAQNNSVNMFIEDGINGQGLYAASIISACKDQTVYALRCTSARDDDIKPTICGPDVSALTVTAGPSVYMVSYVTETSAGGHEAAVSVFESCSLQGTTAASCFATGAIEIDDRATATSFSTVLSGADYHRYQVAITGGAEKTASATGECKPNAGAGTHPNVVRAVGASLAIGLLGVLAL
ncbi:uncharacterized protein B0T15DRAFT_193015 [Chaetomium strumarium]|uniref:GPI anchored cell wall protein n=1 Tax=Chaetomium strumarium TaxID=1170767 RepID=A0AAJ0GSF2_9PEZI|nr:hypothetical protein B0T15DRAFT_193015 [Chaetomium strumarium]